MTIIKNNIPKQNRNNETISNNGGGSYSGGNIIINNGASVVDSLTSSSSSSALSANQGKILNDTKLSKNVEDTAKEKITFNKGLVTKGSITSDEYSRDKGLGLYKDGSGNWNLDIDKATIRKKLSVQDLQIEQAKYVGGKLYCTHASMVVSKLILLSNGFRLHFKKENSDGITIGNQFRVGDMALCQTFNNSGSRRWWRGVTKTGLDFIEVSLGSCEAGSDIPKVGDTVIQFGSANNRERMGAVVIEPLAINVYDLITTFKVPEPLIRLSPTNTKIDADQINFLGKTVINGKFMVAENGDVTMNNATVSGDLKVRTFRMYANQVDNQGILTSSFINMSGDYILPELQPDEVRSLKIFMGRPSRSTTEPAHFTVQNSHVSISSQDATAFGSNLNTLDIFDSMWIAYGFGGNGRTVWQFYLEKKFM